MVGNDIRIKDIKDLYQIFSESIYLSGKITEEELYKELYANSWGIIIEPELGKKVSSDQIAEFIIDLVKFRSEDICMIKPLLKATLYVWFDFQALQLCFNILSGENRTLPFGCNINIIDNPYPILEDFIKVVYNNALYGNYLGITKIIEKSDPEFGTYDNEQLELDKITIDVWKITLPFDENE